MDPVNACFISYRHTDKDAQQFVKAFVRRLKKQLNLWLPNARVYFDEEGLKVGDMYKEELAFELCRSACMVMFFVPLHFDVNHPYCALEYKAMLELEGQRLGQGVADLQNKGLIFPVVYRGLEDLPREIKDCRNYLNFEHLILESDFKKRDCHAELMKLSKQIYDRYRSLTNAGLVQPAPCKQFRFPELGTIKDWLEGVAPVRAFTMPGH
jgi:TIR domain